MEIISECCLTFARGGRSAFPQYIVDSLGHSIKEVWDEREDMPLHQGVLTHMYRIALEQPPRRALSAAASHSVFERGRTS